MPARGRQGERRPAPRRRRSAPDRRLRFRNPRRRFKNQQRKFARDRAPVWIAKPRAAIEASGKLVALERSAPGSAGSTEVRMDAVEDLVMQHQDYVKALARS